ncbi:helix-turn-helix transcriptional regulator [Actinomadura sp. WMMB 499]|uniref:helix-turn-helix domain-containing protein n=1 Tax=Actinomadura sp. WMMB 499 TaxID=1219491 RepID=UPI00159E15E4|nr:helix-turn-helix transcriptional regulator [Actinomadura sp. WMMB 499]
MSDAYGATIAKWTLSRRLKDLRLASGYTANQVCDRLNWGRGKVGRFEANNWVRPELSDIRDLARLYEAGEQVADELEALARSARRRAWWREYGEVFGNVEFPGFENDASEILVYTPLLIPGLLQTVPYLQTLLSYGSTTPEWRELALRARLRRQQILERDEDSAPRLTALVTEAALLYRWGGDGDVRGQYAHLLKMAERPNVELRLLRFEDGLHPGMATVFHIFRFPGGEPPMVYQETDAAIRDIDPADKVEAYELTYEQIKEAALGPAESAEYISKLMATLE